MEVNCLVKAMQAKVSAESVVHASVYRYTRNPVKIGQIRHKTWSWLLTPDGDYDPAWVKRSKDYWELQQETYGLKFSDFTLVVDYPTRTVTTWAVLLDVLPGERQIDFTPRRVIEARQCSAEVST